MLPRSFRLLSTAIYTLKYQSISKQPVIITSTVSAVNHHRKMATSSRVQLSPKDCGVYHLPGISAESAAKGSEVLQENHDHHHIFFNQSGFHSTSSSFVSSLPWPDFYLQWTIRRLPYSLDLHCFLYTAHILCSSYFSILPWALFCVVRCWRDGSLRSLPCLVTVP